MAPVERPDPGDQNPSARPDGRLQRVNRSGDRAWLTVVLVAAAAAAIVGLGLLGGRTETTQPAPLATSAAAAVSAAATTLPPARPATPTPAATSGSGQGVIVDLATPAPGSSTAVYAHIARGLGYRVRQAESPGETIDITDLGRVVTFTESRISLAAHGYGLITVEVGTPAYGLTVPTVMNDTRVFAPDVAALESAVLVVMGATPTRSETAEVAGVTARLLDLRVPFNGVNLSVALAVVGGRDYLIAADGFDAGTAVTSAAARRDALDGLLTRMEWAPPAVFASGSLLFESAPLVDSWPHVVPAPGGDERAGAVVFDVGTADGWVRVDVGTRASPVLAPIRGGAGAPDQPLWGADLEALSTAFAAAYGFGTQAIRAEVDREPALLVERVGDVGVAVLVAHQRRVYVITFGRAFTAQSQELADFLRQFRFLASDPEKGAG